MTLSSLACNPTTLASSATSTCTVTLSKAAPTGGTVVTVSDNSTLLGTPASVTVAAGATSATFSATAGTIPTDQTATVTATLSGMSQTATLNLLASVALSSLACNPTSLSSGATSSCTITLNKTASGATVITFASNNASLTVPASAVVAAGSTTGLRHGYCRDDRQDSECRGHGNAQRQFADGHPVPGASHGHVGQPGLGQRQQWHFPIRGFRPGGLHGRDRDGSGDQPKLAMANGCYLRYESAPNRLWLANNAGSQFTGPATPGTASTLSNSQCSFNAASATVVRAGMTLTLTVPVTFTAAFGGSKNVYLWAATSGGQNSGYQPAGTWTVPGATNGAPAVVSGLRRTRPSPQTFTFTVRDPNGYADINKVYFLVNPTPVDPAEHLPRVLRPGGQRRYTCTTMR